MKKFILALCLTVVASSVFALSYKHSVGVNVGSINGFSYKGYAGKNLHFVIQADLYYQMSYSPVGMLWTETVTGENNMFNTLTIVDNVKQTVSQSVMVAPSFMYQAKVEKWDAGTLNWYAGAGVAVGCSWGGEFDNMSALLFGNYDFHPWLKTGEYLIGGLEFCFDKAPLALGLDLRPGMAQHCTFNYRDLRNGTSLTTLTFDWGANLTLRYCFGK